MVTLKYRDERDRAFGLGGMVVCMSVMDNERFIEEVSLDADTDYGLRLTSDFFQISNQNLSAKTVWNKHLNHFQLLTALLVSNLMSRAMFRNREDISREVTDLLLSQVKEEGKSLCSLEDDEIRELYYKTFNYFHRLFYQSEIEGVIDNIVDKLVARRKLSNDELVSLLQPISRW